MSKCIYCEEPLMQSSRTTYYSDMSQIGGCKSISTYIMSRVDQAPKLVIDTQDNIGYIQIHYCPMCGRELTNE